MRRLTINAAAWGSGTILLTTLWVLNGWQANGAFESFGHEGDPGQWKPTRWALAIGIWGVIVGILALRVYFERPTTDAPLGADRVAGQRRLRALEQQQPARRLGAVDPLYRWYLGARHRALRTRVYFDRPARRRGTIAS